MILNKELKETQIKSITNKTMLDKVWSVLQNNEKLQTEIKRIDYFENSTCLFQEIILDKNINYEFHTFISAGGNEGVYIDLYLRSQNDEIPYNIPCGVIKTLDDSEDGYIAMGKIAGVMTYYAECYLNLNLY